MKHCIKDDKLWITNNLYYQEKGSDKLKKLEEKFNEIEQDPDHIEQLEDEIGIPLTSSIKKSKEHYYSLKYAMQEDPEQEMLKKQEAEEYVEKLRTDAEERH